jgi:starvation-inducible outer membrane lipoprotein
MMLKPSLIVAAALVMTGCAAIPEYKFSKAGASEADFHRDKTQCDDEAFSAGNMVRLKAVEARNACLVKRGWSQVAPK